MKYDNEVLMHEESGGIERVGGERGRGELEGSQQGGPRTQKQGRLDETGALPTRHRKNEKKKKAGGGSSNKGRFSSSFRLFFVSESATAWSQRA